MVILVSVSQEAARWRCVVLFQAAGGIGTLFGYEEAIAAAVSCVYSICGRSEESQGRTALASPMGMTLSL